MGTVMDANESLPCPSHPKVPGPYPCFSWSERGPYQYDAMFCGPVSMLHWSKSLEHMTGISWQQQCQNHQVSIVDLEKCDVLWHFISRIKHVISLVSKILQIPQEVFGPRSHACATKANKKSAERRYTTWFFRLQANLLQREHLGGIIWVIRIPKMGIRKWWIFQSQNGNPKCAFWVTKQP